jgi:hypothetical protein
MSNVQLPLVRTHFMFAVAVRDVATELGRGALDDAGCEFERHDRRTIVNAGLPKRIAHDVQRATQRLVLARSGLMALVNDPVHFHFAPQAIRNSLQVLLQNHSYRLVRDCQGRPFAFRKTSPRQCRCYSPSKSFDRSLQFGLGKIRAAIHASQASSPVEVV